MGLSNAKVIGGQMVFRKLNNSINEQEYKVSKIGIWLNMLNEMKRPRWLNPTSEGTKVNFKIFDLQEAYD